MRKALNENPMVQLAVLGVLALVVGFFLFTRVLGSQAEEAPSSSGATPATQAGAATAPIAPAEPAAGATASSEPSAVDAAVAPEAVLEAMEATVFRPGPGLPGEVVKAYARGETVVLLITKRTATDDRAVRRSVDRIRREQGVTLFVVPLRDVADYARITIGVDLSRVPALVALRPRGRNAGFPEATVSYGFRGPASVLQAVEDVRFDGKSVSYDP